MLDSWLARVSAVVVVVFALVIFTLMYLEPAGGPILPPVTPSP